MNSNALLGVRDRLHSSKWGIPAIFLFLTLLVYGPLLPALGFYWDDWPVISMLWNGSDLWSFYAYDRPFSAWTYVLAGPLLGIRPLAWHVFILLLRWLTTVGVWWTLKQAWPGHPSKVISAALLFAVYPSFTLQPMAVAFSQHFITYALFTFSLGAMLAARLRPEHRGRFTALALGLQVIHLSTMEYFWGLELVRPVLLLALPAAAGLSGERLKAAIKAWLPYLAVLSGFLVWRIFFLQLPDGDPNALALLELYRADLFGGLLHSFNIVVRDLIEMVYRTWTTSLGPSLIDATDRFLLVSWGIAILTGVLVFLYLNGPARRTDAETEAVPFYSKALPAGAIALIVSLLPSWITDNEITVGLFSSRFSIPAMFGSSLFLTGFFDLLLRRTRYKHVMTAVLVCLAAGVHLRNANDFRWDWVKQERFFRQFSQRVPGMLDGTAVFSEGAIFRFVAGYPTSFALNTIYPLRTEYPEMSYWFFELDDDFADVIDRFPGDIRAEDGLRNVWFDGSSLDGLTIFYEPDTGSCLRVLAPEQADLPFLPDLTAEAAAISNQGRILIEEIYSGAALDLIFGSPEAPAWCDLFQRAELARQRSDWEEILDLERQVSALGLEPNERLEWFVFIEAHVQTGDWIGAEMLLLERVYDRALFPDPTTICTLWSRIAVDDPTDVTDLMGCAANAEP